MSRLVYVRDDYTTDPVYNDCGYELDNDTTHPMTLAFRDTVRFWRAKGILLDPAALGLEGMQPWQDKAIAILEKNKWTWNEAITIASGYLLPAEL